MVYEVVNRHSYYRGMIGECEDTIEAHECLWYKIDGVWFKITEVESVE